MCQLHLCQSQCMHPDSKRLLKPFLEPGLVLCGQHACLPLLFSFLQYFAHLRIIPVVAAISEPTPGCTLIELDAVAVSFPHRPWLLPITWLLPDHVAKNVHLKIGVNGSLENGKVRGSNTANHC